MARLLSLLLDAIILFMIVRALMRLFAGSRTNRQTASNTAPPAGRKPTERIGGTLVRDPQCGTYIPEDRALRVRSGDDTLYFCSPACRDAFQQRA